MNIQWQKIDENKMSFKVDQNISSKEVHYSTAQEAAISPVASKIFGFPWTESITVKQDSIEVEKQEWVQWEVLAEPLSNLIKEHIQGQLALNPDSTVEENPGAPVRQLSGSLESPEAIEIQNLIETQINPAVADHGGFVSLIDYKDENVYVELGGGCQGCSMSQATLKEGIATSIMEAFPRVKQVIDVTDHSLGENPFFE